MNPPIQVRRASLAQLEPLLALERACSGVAHWSEAAWRSALQPEAGAMLERAVFVAEHHEALLGFVVVQRVTGSAELENLAVRADQRRQGIAAALCGAAIAWASTNGAGDCAQMHLEVRASNEAALRFYLSQGFVEQARRASYYSHPVEDAVLMSRLLPVTTGEVTSQQGTPGVPRNVDVPLL